MSAAVMLAPAACSQSLRPDVADARSLQGDVSYREAAQDNAATPHYQLQPGQTAVQPSVLEHPAPI